MIAHYQGTPRIRSLYRISQQRHQDEEMTRPTSIQFIKSPEYQVHKNAVTIFFFLSAHNNNRQWEEAFHVGDLKLYRKAVPPPSLEYQMTRMLRGDSRLKREILHGSWSVTE